MPPRPRASPARRSASPAPAVKAEEKKRTTPVAKKAAPAKDEPTRPPYFSDGDTRPTYRGYAYGERRYALALLARSALCCSLRVLTAPLSLACTHTGVLRSSGLAWFTLAVYCGFAIGEAVSHRTLRPVLLVCRLLHAVAIGLNVALSDDLHNLDITLGSRYVRATAAALEQRLHAMDWRAALCVPASYHLLLLLGIMEAERVGAVDKALLLLNLSIFGLMCLRITPSRITPKRELFLSFVATFGGQMVLLLVAFWRERAHHPFWLPLWGVYAIGLLAKAVELPTNDTFGHHEVLHASCILGHALGMIIDATTT